MPTFDHHELSQHDYRAAAEMVLSWKKPLLITHAAPDGDAMGCLIAMRAMLRAQGRDPAAVIYGPCSARYQSMPGAADMRVLTGLDDPVLTDADGVLIMDTCAYSQLGPLADWVRAATIPKLALDHHLTRDELADAYLIDTRAAAAALIVYRWAKAVDWEIPHEAAEAIFVGITTDTGWFRYNNTSPEALRVAAELVERGIDLDAVYQRMFLREPASRLRFRAAAMSRLELLRDDSIAVISVTREMLAAAQVTSADSEDAVNIPMSVGSVEMSVLLVEADEGLVKCGFRSKGGIDVAELAAKFGGGGHARAAGARVKGTVETVKAAILEALDK
jgi:phosphoesterase RecJ-like protein